MPRDPNDIYLDDKKIDGLWIVWQYACALCFSNDDLYQCTIKTAHPIVKQKMLEYKYNDENDQIIYLLAPAEKVRRRLYVQGYTDKACQSLWEHEYNIKEKSSDDWIKKVTSLGLNQSSDWLNDICADLVLKIKYFKPEYVWVEIDLSSWSIVYDLELSVHQNLRRLDTEEFEYESDSFIREIGIVLILTEGKSDTEILSNAIQTMYPEYSDLFQFLDFQEFRIEGGASMLTKMVKALASVRLDQSILALFDNDATGLAEQKQIDDIKTLPDNIKTMVLPELELAKDYPTIGPEGIRRMDVNGAASSIELFLGKKALTDCNGQFHFIRWTNWNTQTKSYQGALEHKEDITKRFLTRIKKIEDPIFIRNEFPEMDQLLNAIFTAFH